MSTAKKFLTSTFINRTQLSVEDVFSTYLYTGNGSTQTITNGIDLSGEGGLVWAKERTSSTDHVLVDTLRGARAILHTNTTDGEDVAPSGSSITGFNDDGFDVGNNYSGENQSGENYVSWTFRSADNFFFLDEVSHINGADTTVDLSSLGTVGMVTVKQTDSTSDWYTWHRSLSAGDLVYLNLSDAATADASISVSGTTLTLDSTLATGDYMVCGWAHDVAAFGENGGQSIIACGSYTGNGSPDGPEIPLGWEPQFIIVKNIGRGNWYLLDNMRGIVTTDASSGDLYFFVEANNAEFDDRVMNLNPDGFKLKNGFEANNNGDTYIYLAIRRGPMRKPESGSDVFAMDEGDTSGGPEFIAGWPIDLALAVFSISVGGVRLLSSRLTQTNRLRLNNDDADESDSRYVFDYQNGWADFSVGSGNYSWMFRRYPGVFDVVTYEGTGTAPNDVPHNLGVPPEFIATKSRDDGTLSWLVYHKFRTATDYLVLNTDGIGGTTSAAWDNTEPTSEVFTVGGANASNASGDNFIAILFATLDGVSKVGSYTGTGNSLTIDCGFSNGAALVWIKRSDSTGDWILYDSTRGIVAGNEPYLVTNTANAQVTGNDYIDPDPSGFTVNGGLADINANGGEYIFLAIAV